MNGCYCVNINTNVNRCYCENKTNEYCSLNTLNRYSLFNNTIEDNSITIFNNNELTDNFLFSTGILYKYSLFDNLVVLKNEEYGNFKELDLTKCKIDYLSSECERYRRASAKYLHEYELVKIICKKKVISRAYFKLYEMIFFENIINLEHLDCLFICEAPGGFIECVTDIRRKKNLITSFMSVSIDNDIKYDKFLEPDNLLYGDITNINIIDSTISKVISKYPNYLDLITADGGFDIKIFNSQEIISTKLILCEIYMALRTQKKNGMFIIKYFDMFTHNSIITYLILCTFYKKVKIIKPKTSRNCNSERYLVCYSFVGINKINKKVVSDIREIIINYTFTQPSMENKYGTYTVLYPYFKFDTIPFLKSKLKNFNNNILNEQIKIINESIKMVYSKDLYLPRLLLTIFMENNLQIIIVYKNILYSRIIKCINWLRLHKISIHQIVYRFNN